ncbi:MAG TPA: VF_A0006 family four-cysteine protein, partial [Xanthobacteraceae bacterium]
MFQFPEDELSRKVDLVVAAIVFAAANFAGCKAPRAQNGIERQAQCELSALRETRSVAAIQLIRSACNWLALNGDSLLNERSKPYYICLVQNLSGVQADEAARATVSAC